MLLQYPKLYDSTWEVGDDGIYDATYFRPRCPQHSFIADVISGSEDCLHLNIYTPDTVVSTYIINGF